MYQSKGPVRKDSLLKQLTMEKLEDGGDVREHPNRFSGAVDKLSEMEVEIKNLEQSKARADAI